MTISARWLYLIGSVTFIAGLGIVILIFNFKHNQCHSYREASLGITYVLVTDGVPDPDGRQLILHESHLTHHGERYPIIVTHCTSQNGWAYTFADHERPFRIANKGGELFTHWHKSEWWMRADHAQIIQQQQQEAIAESVLVNERRFIPAEKITGLTVNSLREWLHINDSYRYPLASWRDGKIDHSTRLYLLKTKPGQNVLQVTLENDIVIDHAWHPLTEYPVPEQ